MRRKVRVRETPGVDFRAAGDLYLRWFVELGSLTPDQAVLEPGCGTGRMAQPLTGYLDATGSYEGFDVVRNAIEWCEENIAPQHPNFHFRHVDVLNGVYNPEGQLDPETFEFPYPDESFDFAFLTSVFTHMLPPELRHYLQEIRRVLRPQGRCLMTFFLLNEESLDAARAGRAKRRFAHEGDGYFYDIARRPEAAVAYREEDVLGFFEQAGFELHAPIRYGRWTGRQSQGAGQDMLVVKPA
ncbi:MAG TPA: class I SAM-dependent methyltransferase [Solirubrobacterales bacterium]|nr:class I SAM-dependent methyltransferase [Solirubrobacterales bacterium]